MANFTVAELVLTIARIHHGRNGTLGKRSAQWLPWPIGSGLRTGVMPRSVFVFEFVGVMLSCTTTEL